MMILKNSNYDCKCCDVLKRKTSAYEVPSRTLKGMFHVTGNGVDFCNTCCCSFKHLFTQIIDKGVSKVCKCPNLLFKVMENSF